MELNFCIRTLRAEERETALALAWKVFQEFEAPDYPKDGVEEFYKSIHDDSYLSMLCFYGAFVEGKLVGMLAARSEGKHIALFFVDKEYQRKGIGKNLIETAKAECNFEKMTVNAAPCAVPIYHKLGFNDSNTEQTANGIRFTPMELIL